MFHQLKNITKKYSAEFGGIEEIPDDDFEIFELAQNLATAKSVIESSFYHNKILELSSNQKLSSASKKVIAYINEIFVKILNCLKKELLQ